MSAGSPSRGAKVVRRRRLPRERYSMVVVVVIVVMALVLGVGGGGVAPPGLSASDGGVVQPRVVGGETVPDGKFPFVTALLDTRRGSKPTKQQFCTGALID